MKNLLAILASSLSLISCSQNDEPVAQVVVLADLEQASEVLFLEAQLQQAESIKSVKRVQNAYAQYLGAGLWNEAADLFSDDAVAHFSDKSVSGIDNIRSYFLDEMGKGINGLSFGEINQHLIISPVINLSENGGTAMGRWRLVSLQGKYEESAIWQGGIFENHYVNESGVWKISELKFYPIYGGEFKEGWRNFKEETAETVEAIPYHYTADSAGIPAPPLSLNDMPAVNSDALGSQEDLAQKLANIEHRTQRLLDENAVTNLQHAYGYYQDRKMWDDLAELFNTEGSLELGKQGIYSGRDSIRQALEQFGEQNLKQNEVFDHIQLQTLVTVSSDGQTAKARGTELQMLGVHEQESQWGVSIFNNSFIKVGGQWQIDDVHVYTRMLTDYNQGWAVDAQAGLLANAEFPADLPTSEEYGVYPEFYSPEFSFVNPVTGITDAIKVSNQNIEVNEARLDELSRKLRVLNAYEGAENVSNAYGYYIDEFMWDGMADVFAIDGWKELSGIGAYVGRERVRYSVVSRYGANGRRANSNTFHQKTQPVISVAQDGYSASIRTRLFQMNSSRSNAGSYNSGIYENTIVIEDGIWRILGMDLDYTWTSSYDGGWQAVALGSDRPALSLEGEAAPDRPLRGLVSAPYPRGVVDMAFHYRNLVSEREPPILLNESLYVEFPE